MVDMYTKRRSRIIFKKKSIPMMKLPELQRNRRMLQQRPLPLKTAPAQRSTTPSLMKCRPSMMGMWWWMLLTAVIVVQSLIRSNAVAAAAAFHVESLSSSVSSAHQQQQQQQQQHRSSWFQPSLSSPSFHRQQHQQRQSVVLLHAMSSSSSSSSSDSNSENDVTSNDVNNNNNNNKQWMESLRARQNQLSQQSQHIHDNWKSGRCDSQVAAVLGDWVRRLDVDYPLVACGSASEAIYVSHLETGHVVMAAAAAAAEPTSSSSSSSTVVDGNDNDSSDHSELPGQDHVYRLLFGEHDGGGTLAIAFYDNLIASAGRKGSVDLWRVHHHPTTTTSSSGGSSTTPTPTTSLIYQGRMVACQGVLVTSLQFQLHDGDDDAVYLWIGTADGRVMAFDTSEQLKEDRLPLAVRRKPDMQFHFPDSVILSMAFTNELHMMMNDEDDDDHDDDDDDDDDNSAGVGVITTSDGNVHLISLSSSSNSNNNNQSPSPQSQSQPSSWSFRLPMEVRTARIPKALATCACFVQHDTTRSCLDNGQPSQPQSSSFWSIAFGGSNGALYIQPLSMLPNGRIDRLRPFDNNCTPMPLLPRHWGPTQCVATPMPGLLLSGGQDGSIRVWDVSCTNPPSSAPTADTASSSSMLPTTTTTSSPPSSSLPLPRPLLRRRFLYQFHGYKVWLKSLWCGNNMGVKSRYGSDSGSSTSTSHPSPFLVSDGSDNTILLHKFDKPPPMNKRKSNDLNNNNNNKE